MVQTSVNQSLNNSTEFSCGLLGDPTELFAVLKQTTLLQLWQFRPHRRGGWGLSSTLTLASLGRDWQELTRARYVMILIMVLSKHLYVTLPLPLLSRDRVPCPEQTASSPCLFLVCLCSSSLRTRLIVEGRSMTNTCPASSSTSTMVWSLSFSSQNGLEHVFLPDVPCSGPGSDQL